MTDPDKRDDDATARALVDALRHPYGRDDLRRVHALGIGASGRFVASPIARDYCIASHFQLFEGDRPQDDPNNSFNSINGIGKGQGNSPSGRSVLKHTPVTIRFSNGSGSAVRRDGWSDVRGMATRFHLADGSDTDLIAMTLPEFFSPTADTFLAFAREAYPAPCSRESPWRKILDLLRLTLPMRDPYPGEDIRPDEGAIRYADGKDNAFARLAVFQAASIGAPTSYVRAAYHAVHTFIVTAPDGARRWVRFIWQPIDGVLNTRPDAPPIDDYLDRELTERLAKGPARFSLMMSIGETGDAFDDSTRPWPPHRARINMGTLTVEKVFDAEGQIKDCELLSFNPWRLTKGVEPSGDPVLSARRDAYELSSTLRHKARGVAACPFSRG